MRRETQCTFNRDEWWPLADGPRAVPPRTTTSRPFSAAKRTIRPTSTRARRGASRLRHRQRLWFARLRRRRRIQLPPAQLGTVRAGFTSQELDAVYMVSHRNFWSDFGVGVNNTNTYLNPYDPNNTLRGDQVEMKVLTDGGTAGGPWRVDWNGYYGTRCTTICGLAGTHRSLRSGGWERYSTARETPPTILRGGPVRRSEPLDGEKGELTFSVGQAWQSGFSPRAYVRAPGLPAFLSRWFSRPQRVPNRVVHRHWLHRRIEWKPAIEARSGSIGPGAGKARVIRSR